MSADRQTEWLAQTRRGLLEMAVLALIGQESTYGYAIVTKLSEQPALAAGEGTIYPLLRRLRRDGLLETSWHESDAGPPRQYYELSNRGHEHLAALRNEWLAIVGAIDETLNPEEER